MNGNFEAAQDLLSCLQCEEADSIDWLLGAPGQSVSTRDRFVSRCLEHSKLARKFTDALKQPYLVLSMNWRVVILKFSVLYRVPTTTC